MKIKFLSIFAAAALLTACGMDEETQQTLESDLENLQQNLKDGVEDLKNETATKMEEVSNDIDSTLDTTAVKAKEMMEGEDKAHSEEEGHEDHAH